MPIVTGAAPPLQARRGYATEEHAHTAGGAFFLDILRRLIYPLKLVVWLWNFSRALAVVVLLVPLLGGVVLEYMQLSQVGSSLYMVNMQTGTTEWQQAITAPVQVEAVDAQGSLLTVPVGRNLHQLVAFDPRGVLQWKSFVSAFAFSLPFAPMQSGTLLVALTSSHLANTEAENSSFKLHPLRFYLLKRRTGQVLWQRTIVAPGAQQSAALLGAEGRLIYIALTGGNTGPGKAQAVTELLALDQVSGNVAWRVSSSPVSQKMRGDGGRLLLHQQLIFWQVAGTIYALNAASGSLLWQRFLLEDDIHVLLQEESQMAETTGVLVVERSDIYHALDITSGQERWVLFNPDINAASGQASGGLATFGNTLLLYGAGQIQDFDAINQHLRWSQKQLTAILNVHIAGDGTLVYATVLDSVEGGSPAQALVALDLKNGAVKWTFQPVGRAAFVPLGVAGILLWHSRLLTMTCSASPQHGCASMGLYVLQADSGRLLWKYEANAVSDVHYSSDGNTILFQGNSSAWSDLIAHFRN